MKRIAFAVSVAVLVFGAAILAKTQTASVEQELIKLENEWGDAAIKLDFAFFDKILAEDYTTIDPNGFLVTKTQFIANLKAGDDVTTSAAADEMKVRVYGDTAVVTGRSTVKGKYKGNDTSGQYRWADTWIKMAGRWQCVVSAGAKIVQK